MKQIVVGLPLRLDGTRGEMAEEAARFAERVRKQFGVPVEMVDERLTSWEAERLLEEQAGRVLHDRRKRAQETQARIDSASVDAVAAAVILKEYLERATNAEQKHLKYECGRNGAGDADRKTQQLEDSWKLSRLLLLIARWPAAARLVVDFHRSGPIRDFRRRGFCRSAARRFQPGGGASAAAERRDPQRDRL